MLELELDTCRAWSGGVCRLGFRVRVGGIRFWFIELERPRMPGECERLVDVIRLVMWMVALRKGEWPSPTPAPLRNAGQGCQGQGCY